MTGAQESQNKVNVKAKKGAKVKKIQKKLKKRATGMGRALVVLNKSDKRLLD